MTFAVQINEGPRYVVHSKSILGAFKAALETSAVLGGVPTGIEAVRIDIVPITNKASA